MSDDNRIEVQFTGDTSGLDKAAKGAEKDVKAFGDAAEKEGAKAGSSWLNLAPIFSKVASVLHGDIKGDGVNAMGSFGRVGSEVADTIKEKWSVLPAGFRAVALAAVGAAAAIGAFLIGKEFAERTAKATEETRDFARALGVNTNEASAYKAALEDVGAGQGEFEALAKGMVRQLKENESAVQALGLKTRDAAGNLRPLTDLTMEGIEVLRQHEQGTSRAIAGQQLFGRAADASSRVLLLNKETVDKSRQAIKDLNLEVGEASVKAWEDWDEASDRAELGLKGFGKAIGDAVMPVVTELTTWFNTIAPGAIVVLRGVLSTLSTAFLGVTQAIVVLWEVGKAALYSLTDPIVQFGTALGHLMKGEFNQARETMMGIPSRVGDAWVRAWDEIGASAGRTSDRVKRLWAWATDGDVAPGDSGAGTGTKQAKVKPLKAEKDTLPESYMSYYEAMLAEEKNVQATLTQGRQYTKQEELAFWQFLKDGAKLTSADQVAVFKKMADLEVKIAQEKAQQTKQIAENEVEHAQRMGEAQIAADQANAQLQFQLGNLTRDQLFVAEEEFENRRFTLRQRSIQSRMELIDPTEDPVAYASLKSQIEEIEIAHQARLAEIRGTHTLQSAQQQMSIWSDLQGRVGSLWDQGIEAMMNGTLRWNNAMRAIGAQLLGWFTSAVIKPMVLQWIFGEQAKTGATAAGTASRFMMETFAAAKSIALWAATAVKNIATSAWEAMAGAYKAIVGIPYVGPFLAPAMAAAAFAGVIRLAGNVASAENGYDIPAGVNPMVQAHAKEMVLPAKYADVIRGAADNGGGAGAPSIEFKGKALRGNLFLMHKDDMIEAMQSLYRDGSLRF